MTAQQMTGQEAIAYIHGRFGVGKKRDMENIKTLLALLGNPQDHFRSVHVAGTNGKGSVCAYIAGVLQSAGYPTGLYTSPYLQYYNERICIDGVPVSDEALGAATTRVRAAVEQMERENLGNPTEFEVGTAVAFTCFAMAGCAWVVVEVGIGGRHDVTNVIVPEVSVIVSIGLDHVKLLGDTPEQIAYEKAGIAKAGVPLVVYPQSGSVMAVIDYCAGVVGAPVRRVLPGAIRVLSQDRFGASFTMPGLSAPVTIHIPGRHQIFNAATALQALWTLRERGTPLDDAAILQGFAQTRWHGRLEWVRDNVLIDGAHNRQGAMALADYLKTYLPGANIALICGVLRDKDAPGIAEALSRFADSACVVAPDSYRALDAADFARLLESRGVQTHVFPSFAQAFAAARGDYVVIAGSLYLAGEARTALLGKATEPTNG